MIGRIGFIPILINCVAAPEVDQPLFRSLVPTVEGALRRDGQVLYGGGLYIDVVFRGVLEWRLLHVRLVSLSAIENVQETGLLRFLSDCQI